MSDDPLLNIALVFLIHEVYVSSFFRKSLLIWLLLTQILLIANASLLDLTI